MGRFDPTYTDQQRAAVSSAINDKCLSAPEVVSAARSGSLEDGLDPFEIPETTVRDVAAQDARGTDRSSRTPELRALFDQTATLVESELAELRAAQLTNGRLDTQGMTRLGKVIRATRGVVDLSQALGLVERQQGSASLTNRPTETPSLMEKLKADFDARSKDDSAPSTPEPTP